MKGNNLKKKIAYILSIVFLLTSVYTGNFSYAETDKKGNFAIETDGYITVDGGNIYKKTTEVTGFENKKFGNIYIDKGGKFGWSPGFESAIWYSCPLKTHFRFGSIP